MSPTGTVFLVCGVIILLCFIFFGPPSDPPGE